MSARTVRRVVIVVCLLGIGGMVAGSVADDNALVLTFGLITAVAIACLMVATAVGGSGTPPVDEGAAARLEERIAALVADGADEEAVRALVRGAMNANVGAGVHGGRTPRPDG